ncbi:MAG: hypothetical protein ACFFDP_09515 [Promethearchaeota archaeon]
MSVAYYWRTVDDAALLILLLGFLGTIQIFLSYSAAYTLYIASPLILAFVPLGVVLVQATGSALLADTLHPLLLSQHRHPHTTPTQPLRQYFLRFAILLLAAGIILAVWGLVFFLTLASPLVPVNLVKYIVGNTSGAIISLIFVQLVIFFFKR